jgi:hypothetical protein
MRFAYLVYPEAIEKIERSGLVERGDACLGSDDYPTTSYIVDEREVVACVEDMQNRGYFKKLPAEQAASFRDGLERVYRNIKKSPWKVTRATGVNEEPAELSDVLLLAGWLPSFFLSPNELWDYRCFGFSSLSAFTGALSAYMVNREKEKFEKRGLRWTAQRDGRTLVSEITGNDHSDFELLQTDVTPYPTLDPLGHEVSYRPECRKDMKGLFSHHSVEGNFLAILLKYAEQERISSPLLQERARPLIDYVRSLGQSIGFTTEHLTGTGLNPRILFAGYDAPLTNVDENLRSEGRRNWCFLSSSDNPYLVHVGRQRDLVFLQNVGEERTVAASFQPAELDDLLRGWMFQAAKGLGRTSARELVAALTYKFSGRYEQDLEQFRRLPT